MRLAAPALLVLLAAAGCTSAGETAPGPPREARPAVTAHCEWAVAAPSDTAARVSTPEFVRLQPPDFRDLDAAEAAFGSERFWSDTIASPNHYTSYQARYRRRDPDLPGVPVVVAYWAVSHPDSADAVARGDFAGRGINYKWGGEEPWAGDELGDLASWVPWVPLSAEGLGAFLRRYEEVRARVVETFGPPTESRPLACSPCFPDVFGLGGWHRSDLWRVGGTEVVLGVGFSVPCVERPRTTVAQGMWLEVYHPR